MVAGGALARPPDAAPAPRTFENPIVPGFFPDPSICRVGDDYYLVNSSFEYFPGVPIFHSRDLVHWRQIGHVLTEKRQLDLTGAGSSRGIYAPTLRYHDGRFYLITTLIDRGGNFYVTATRPEGPWSDPVWLDKDGFDPSLTFADGQIYYLRDGKGRDFSHPQVWLTTLDPKTGKVSAPPKPIWAGTGGVWPEGAHLYKRGDRYYLFAAEGGTEYGHMEVVGRSASPFGPYEPSPRNPILSHGKREAHPIQATGHADIVDLPDGTTWAVFLGIRPQDGKHHHLGRETFLAPVTWDKDGWPVIGNAGGVELEMEAPRLPPRPFPPDPARDEFAGPTLGPTWSYLRNPDPADHSLSARPGFLRLVGSAVTLDDVASPALVVRRQQHQRVACKAELDFSPRRPNEEAGLTVRANERFHYDLLVRLGAAGREALLQSRVAGVTTTVGRAALGDGPVRLDVVARDGAYTFAVEAAGKTETLGRLPAEPLSSEEIGKHGGNHFTGAVIGLYATGHGQRSTAPADFDWFEYQP
jgi:alpha-N-arabinofuranosidase